MKVLIYKKDRIDYILNGLAKYFKVERQDLGKYYRKPEKHNRKRIAIKLLVDVADCTYEDVCNAMGIKGRNNPWYIYQSIKDDLTTEYGNKELKKEYLAIKDYLGL